MHLVYSRPTRAYSGDVQLQAFSTDLAVYYPPLPFDGCRSLGYSVLVSKYRRDGFVRQEMSGLRVQMWGDYVLWIHNNEFFFKMELAYSRILRGRMAGCTRFSFASHTFIRFSSFQGRWKKLVDGSWFDRRHPGAQHHGILMIKFVVQSENRCRKWFKFHAHMRNIY